MMLPSGINPLLLLTSRTNTVTGVKYINDPTILMITLYGEIDPSPNPNDIIQFYKQSLAYLKTVDANHIHATGGFSYLNCCIAQDTWKTVMSDPNDDICEVEINSIPDRDWTIPHATQFCRDKGKPWFLAAWSSCLGLDGYNNKGNDSGMAAHAQDMYNIAKGRSPAAMPAIGTDFWNFSGANKNSDPSKGCDINSSGELPLTYAIVQNTASSVPAAIPTVQSAQSANRIPIPAGTGYPIIGIDGKCLDLTDGNTTDSTAIQIWTCNNGGNQKWTLNDGALQSLGKCLDIQEGNFSAGNKLQIRTCNHNNSQQWIFDSDGTIRPSGASNLCLEVPNPNGASHFSMTELWYSFGNAIREIIRSGRAPEDNTQEIAYFCTSGLF